MVKCSAVANTKFHPLISLGNHFHIRASDVNCQFVHFLISLGRVWYRYREVGWEPARVNSQKDMSAVGAILEGSFNSRMFCLSALVAVSELFINFPPLRAFSLWQAEASFLPFPFCVSHSPLPLEGTEGSDYVRWIFPDGLPVNYMRAFPFLLWKMLLFLWLGTSVQHTVKVGHQADLDYQLFHECNKIPSVGVPAREKWAFTGLNSQGASSVELHHNSDSIETHLANKRRKQTKCLCK